MFKFKRGLVLLVVLTVALAACGGGGSESVPAGEVGGGGARGKSLYEQTVIGSSSAPGCITCHSLEPGVTLIGPSHSDVAARAAETIKSSNYTGNGKTVEEYLRESIVDPNVFVEEGFPSGVMYQNYGKDLSDQEIDDLVAFLMTLK